MSRGWRWLVAVWLVAALAAGCREEKAPSLAELKPAPLPVPVAAAAAPAEVPVDGGPEVDERAARERLFQVEDAPVFGEPRPGGAARLEIRDESFLLEGEPFDPAGEGAQQALRALGAAKKPVLIVPDDEAYLALASPLFAALDDAGVSVWLAHPDEGDVAFPITLSDEADFRAWLDEIAAGKVRIIHRADGYELQTNIGKLPGPDPNGPSVPLRGGKWDIARLRASLVALKERFSSDQESCIVPSFGMELDSVARALTAYYTEPGDRLFEAVCLVYPRPATAKE